MKSLVYENELFLESFLYQIQKFILGYRNFDLFFEVLTKENNPSYNFKNSMIITVNNYNDIFKNFDLDQLNAAYELMNKGYIRYKKDPQAAQNQEEQNDQEH